MADTATQSDEFRKNLLLDIYGPVEAQKNALVDEIEQAFTNPERWPMDDGARIQLLRALYRRARAIRQAEAVCKAKQDEGGKPELTNG